MSHPVPGDAPAPAPVVDAVVGAGAAAAGGGGVGDQLLAGANAAVAPVVDVLDAGGGQGAALAGGGAAPAPVAVAGAPAPAPAAAALDAAAAAPAAGGEVGQGAAPGAGAAGGEGVGGQPPVVDGAPAAAAVAPPPPVAAAAPAAAAVAGANVAAPPPAPAPAPAPVAAAGAGDEDGQPPAAAAAHVVGALGAGGVGVGGQPPAPAPVVAAAPAPVVAAAANVAPGAAAAGGGGVGGQPPAPAPVVAAAPAAAAAAPVAVVDAAAAAAGGGGVGGQPPALAAGAPAAAAIPSFSSDEYPFPDDDYDAGVTASGAGAGSILSPLPAQHGAPSVWKSAAQGFLSGVAAMSGALPPGGYRQSQRADLSPITVPAPVAGVHSVAQRVAPRPVRPVRLPPEGYRRVFTAAAAAASPPAPAGDYLPLSPTASFEITSLLHFLSRDGVVFIPTDLPTFPYLGLDREGGKILLDQNLNLLPRYRGSDAERNRLAQAVEKNIKKRISALLPRTWSNEKGSPITARELLDHGGRLKIHRNEKGLFQSSSVELDLPESLTLPKKKVAGKMRETIIIARIEITQNGDLSLYTARGVKTTLADYDKNVQKNILTQFLSVAGKAGTDESEDRRAEELAKKLNGEIKKAKAKAKALEDAKESSSKRSLGMASATKAEAAGTGTLGGGTIAALPAKSEAVAFKTPLPNGFQHFAGIRSGNKKVTHCESYPDGSYRLFDGDSSIARSNELEKTFHHSEIQNIAAQKELQLQALEAILSCKKTSQNRDLIIAATNCLERFVVERDGERGFKFQLPKVGANKPGSISITSAGEITLNGKLEDIRSLSKKELDVSGWPSSQRKKNKERQSDKVKAVVRLVPAVKDLSTFSEAHITGCRDESELLKLFFLTYGAKYLSSAKDVDRYDSDKRLIFTFGAADQFVEIKLPSGSSIMNPIEVYKLTTVGSKVTLDKLIELIKAENPGIHDEKTSQVEALFAARSKEIALERKGKKPLPSAMDRKLKLQAIEKKYHETFPSKSGRKNAIQSITDNTSNNITTIGNCDETVDLLRYIGKNLFQRIKDADVDYEVKSSGLFFRHKIQNYKFHLEAPSERGEPTRSFDFVISVEENGEISSYDLKWNPESKDQLQPTFENVAEAMNRMGGLNGGNHINVEELRTKSTQLKLPSSPTMIVPLPKGFEHNPGLFTRNKPCKFCAIHSDGTRTLLDKYGDIVASGDQIKESEQNKIAAQLDLIEEVASRLEGGVAMPQATREDEDAKILRALVEKLLRTVPVEEVKKASVKRATARSTEEKPSYKLPLPKEGWSIEISDTGVVTLKGCVLEKALNALKLRREDLLPSVGKRVDSLTTGGRSGSHDVATVEFKKGERVHGGSVGDAVVEHEEDGMRLSVLRHTGGDEEKRKADAPMAVGLEYKRGSDDDAFTRRPPSRFEGRREGTQRSVPGRERGEEEQKVIPMVAGGGERERYDYDSSSDDENTHFEPAAARKRRPPSPSVEPLFSAQVARQSRLTKMIVNIAILALPEGKEIEDLITAVNNAERVSELGSSYAKQFQEFCSVYNVTSSSAESKSGESGMSFKEACNRERNSDILRQLSPMRGDDLADLKQQAFDNLLAASSKECGQSV